MLLRNDGSKATKKTLVVAAAEETSHVLVGRKNFEVKMRKRKS
jgi:hypothetical protein